MALSFPLVRCLVTCVPISQRCWLNQLIPNKIFKPTHTFPLSPQALPRDHLLFISEIIFLSLISILEASIPVACAVPLWVYRTGFTSSPLSLLGRGEESRSLEMNTVLTKPSWDSYSLGAILFCDPDLSALLLITSVTLKKLLINSVPQTPHL